MSALRIRKDGERLHVSAYSIELRKRVERLEHIREDACMRRDRDRVTLIDKQIQHAIAEWKTSFVTEIEREVELKKAG